MHFIQLENKVFPVKEKKKNQTQYHTEQIQPETDDNPCLENLSITVFVCLSSQLYEAVLLCDYCMDIKFTEIIFFKIVLCGGEKQLICHQFNLSESQRNSVIFSFCFSELIFCILLKHKNVWKLNECEPHNKVTNVRAYVK